MANGQLWTAREDELAASATNYNEYLEMGGSRERAAFVNRRYALRKRGYPVMGQETTTAHSPRIPAADHLPDLPQSPATDKEEDWAKYFRLVEELAEHRQGISDHTKLVEWDSPDGRKPIGIAFYGDCHIGSRGVRYTQLREDLQTIRDTPGVWCVNLGDVTDNFQLNSKAQTGLYDSGEPNPREQQEHAFHILRESGDKHIALLAGNHDGWSYKSAGLSPLVDLAKRLNTTYVSETGAMFVIRAGGVEFKIIAKHQFRGGSQMNKSASADRLYRDWPWDADQGHADAVVLAHIHEPDCHITMRHGRPVTFVRVGTYKTQDQYAESAGYRPEYGVGFLILNPADRSIIPFHPAQWRLGLSVLDMLRGGGV